MEINQIKKRALIELGEIKDLTGLEAFRIKYLSRKDGELTAILRSLKNLSVGERRKIGPEANRLKQELTEAIEKKKENFRPRWIPLSGTRYKN